MPTPQYGIIYFLWYRHPYLYEGGRQGCLPHNMGFKLPCKVASSHGLRGRECDSAKHRVLDGQTWQ